MSVQAAKVEIARAKLITALVLLSVLAGSCAPGLIAQAPAVTAPAKATN